MKDVTIQLYSARVQEQLMVFYQKVFKENHRKLDLHGKDRDLKAIETQYMADGCFWCAIDTRGNIIGTLALRPLSDCHEVRRFFVLRRKHNNGIGTTLLSTAINYAINNNISELKAATMEEGTAVHHLFAKYGFVITKRYNDSAGDVFFKLKLDLAYKYNFKLDKLKRHFQSSLILNPTENIPMYDDKDKTAFLEGLYVSERFKDLNDKIIFAGRNEYISFFESLKFKWADMLGAYDVDLKPLAGLNAHLVLFLCILQPGEVAMILPEICGGHFSTEKILTSLGVHVLHMEPDIIGQCVDIGKTSDLIYKHNPHYIFVDRSEGLIYEDFSWLRKFDKPYKIFDASQYLSQILLKMYNSPFDMGFDMIVSTLHKNYPGPQKGMIAVQEDDTVWKRYVENAKTYISNTHPLSIARSLLPSISSSKFREYIDESALCTNRLESELERLGIPVVSKKNMGVPTLHTWILCPTKEDSYQYYLKLEQLNLLVNYRLLPYNLGYGLRIGTTAAVRCGLRSKHIGSLARIMAQAYYEPITPLLKKQAQRFISSINH